MECQICNEKGDTIKSLCNHNFHEICIVKHLEEYYNCPICINNRPFEIIFNIKVNNTDIIEEIESNYSVLTSDEIKEKLKEKNRKINCDNIICKNKRCNIFKVNFKNNRFEKYITIIDNNIENEIKRKYSILTSNHDTFQQYKTDLFGEFKFKGIINITYINKTIKGFIINNENDTLLLQFEEPIYLENKGYMRFNYIKNEEIYYLQEKYQILNRKLPKNIKEKHIKKYENIKVEKNNNDILIKNI
jgi:hypothetical protein